MSEPLWCNVRRHYCRCQDFGRRCEDYDELRDKLDDAALKFMEAMGEPEPPPDTPRHAARLTGDRLTEVISWAETECAAFAKFPHSAKDEKASYLWMLCQAILDLRDDALSMPSETAARKSDIRCPVCGWVCEEPEREES